MPNRPNGDRMKSKSTNAFSLRSKTLSHPRHCSIVPFPPTHENYFGLRIKLLSNKMNPHMKV